MERPKDMSFEEYKIKRAAENARVRKILKGIPQMIKDSNEQ